jgi:fructose-1-phosphate kinase PfkB-like protein
VLDSEGMALRRGVEAEPFLVAPNQSEAESLAGQEFNDDEDFLMALDAIADIGARNVLITTEDGCFALLREERAVRRLHAVVELLEPVSKVGSGDTLLAGFLAARAQGKQLDEALRLGVAAGMASTLELGAGRFDPREVTRLAAAVKLNELAAATA